MSRGDFQRFGLFHKMDDVSSAFEWTVLRPRREVPRLRILTLNLGLLGFRAARLKFFAMADHVQHRLEAAPEILARLGADVLALQEVYDPCHRRYLATALRDVYPHAYGVADRWSIFSNGLFVLSRFPIASGEYVAAKGFPRHERLVSRKGYLCVEIDAPGFCPVRLINVHLTVSGLLVQSDGPIDDSRRCLEIADLLSLAGRADAAPALLVGDFNCSPTVHQARYRQIIAAGYVDSFAVANPHPSAAMAATWDPANALNAGGPFRDSPRQRIDHVFVPRDLLPQMAPVASAVVLDRPVVQVGPGQRVTLSDHYGLMTDFESGIAVSQHEESGESRFEPAL